MIEGKTIRNEKEYRALPVDSSSSLKEFSLDRKKYYKKYILGDRIEEEDNKASVMGRVVETLLLEEEEFDNRFSMSSVAKAPTGLMLAFVDALINLNVVNEEEVEFKELALQAYKISGFKWKFEAVLEKFVGTDNEIYFKEGLEIKKKGLTILTADDITNAEKIVETLKNSPYTADIINLENGDTINVYNQLQIEGFNIDGVEMKGMLDKVHVNHKRKTIQWYDLKCVWAVENFLEEYYLYRRSYIQAKTYDSAVRFKFKDLINEGYTVLSPKFIICDSINYYSPLIYKLSSDDLEDAYNGFEYKGRKYPGMKEIIEDLKFAKENDCWNISRKNYINNGIVNLKG